MPKHCKNMQPPSIMELCNSVYSHPWKCGWDTDKQLFPDTINGYLSTAKDLRPEMLAKVRSILALAPNALLKYDKNQQDISKSTNANSDYDYYNLSQIDELICNLKHNPDDPHFLKTEQSANRKVSDPSIGCEPAKIKDYLRFQIVTPNVEEITTIRDILLSSQGTITSYKDQFRRPCPEGGHRAFKFHILLEKNDKYMVAEGQIGHQGLEELDVTKSLRASERSIQKANLESSKQSLRQIWNGAICEATEKIMALRRAINYDFCREHGLDILLDKDISPEQEFNDAYRVYQSSSSTDTTKKILRGIREKMTASINDLLSHEHD